MYVKQRRARPPAAYSTRKLVAGSGAEPLTMKDSGKKAILGAGKIAFLPMT
jgi:hypothetical protein